MPPRNNKEKNMTIEQGWAQPERTGRVGEQKNTTTENMNFLNLLKEPGISSNKSGQDTLSRNQVEHTETVAAPQAFSEAYDYIQAKNIANGLEKTPDLKAVDESLKKMSEREANLVVEMVNHDLGADGSKLHLDLQVSTGGCMSFYEQFDLKLTEDGKAIDQDSWRHSLDHKPKPPVLE